MPDPIIVWPPDILVPAACDANPTPFSRSGGTSLGGIQRSIRTDRGWWRVDYKGVVLRSAAGRRAWNAIRSSASGMAGVIALPIWSFDANGLADGLQEGRRFVPHSDGSSYSDGAMYQQPQIVVEAAAAVAIGDTSIALRLVYGIDQLSGVRFSYQNALYETGNPTSIVDDVWTVDLFPAAREAIPEGAALEFDLPTCLVHLASDDAMDAGLTAGLFDKVDVSFVEAVDYWNDLAGA